ncbi:hypothetical protein [Natronorubrum halophilum]|uniref:hypothetical protein n=1 Tax=Natronorubrum halophilum TaxID=1702106 RepID=UPI0010C15FB8|nr:hypothetical protein [Natronorubrum halophilum]
MSEELNVRPEDALEVAQQALAEVQDLEQRVAELEANDESTVDYDDRDEAVIDYLDPGETVPIKRLHKLYQRHTDIRADDTLKNRVRGLVAGPDFKIARAGEIVYDPDGGERR